MLPPPRQSLLANQWVIALTVTMATFMEVLDTSIANVSLPHIAGNLSVSTNESTWVLTSYLVANAVVLPLSGWLSSILGRKRFYMSCVLIFTISSMLCGVATSLGQLIFFRVLQGMGGGGLQPSEQAILVDTFPPQKRGMAMAVYGMAILVAPVLGPTLGGWITDNYSWRWIFFINAPVGCLSLMMSSLVLRDPPHLIAKRAELRKKKFQVDFIGLSLLTLGLAALEIVLDKGQEVDWFGSRMIVYLSVVAGVALVAVVIWELRHPQPIVNLRLLKERNFRFCAGLVLRLRSPLWQHRPVARIDADSHGLFGDEGRAGHVAGRPVHHARDAADRLHARAAHRCAVADHDGAGDRRLRGLLDVDHESGGRPLSIDRAPNRANAGRRNALGAGKHGRVYVHPSRSNQQCLGVVQSDPQRGIEPRCVRSDDVAGAEQPGASKRRWRRTSIL